MNGDVETTEPAFEPEMNNLERYDYWLSIIRSGAVSLAYLAAAILLLTLSVQLWCNPLGEDSQDGDIVVTQDGQNIYSLDWLYSTLPYSSIEGARQYYYDSDQYCNPYHCNPVTTTVDGGCYTHDAQYYISANGLTPGGDVTVQVIDPTGNVIITNGGPANSIGNYTANFGCYKPDGTARAYGWYSIYFVDETTGYSGTAQALVNVGK